MERHVENLDVFTSVENQYLLAESYVQNYIKIIQMMWKQVKKMHTKYNNSTVIALL
jgi:hypothetical protein